MKKHLHLIFSLPIFLLLSSCNWPICNDDYIWDWYPIVFKISVEDGAGNDLLKNGTIDPDEIAIEFKGERIGVYPAGYLDEFAKNNPGEKIKPRKAPGLRSVGPSIEFGAAIKILENGRQVLTIGEYSGEHTYNGEEIVIIWPDGSKDTITFSRKFVGCGKNTKVKDTVMLNGEKIAPMHSIQIVK